MKKLCIAFILLIHNNITPISTNIPIGQATLAAYATEQSAFATLRVVCPAAVPQAAIPIALPNFIITMQDFLGRTVNTFTFPTNPNFKSRLAILTVQIFEPTNIITQTDSVNTITTGPNENSYALVYTLQSPDGVYFQQEIQYPTSRSQTPFMPIVNGYPTFPIILTIATTTQTLCTTQILPNFTQPPPPHPQLTQQQLYTSISPITQKFFITTNALGLLPTATAMSGSYDPNSNLTTPVLITSVIPATASLVPPIDPTSDPNNPTFIPNIPITLYDGTTPYTITLQPSTIQLNEVDLINGVLIHLFIYPPLYQNCLTATATNFIFIVTMQTIDGLKFTKLVSQPTSTAFTHYPTTFTITATSLEGNVTTLTSSIANSLLTTPIFNLTTSPQIYNMLSPFNIRMFLQQNVNNDVVISIS